MKENSDLCPLKIDLLNSTNYRIAHMFKYLFSGAMLFGSSFLGSPVVFKVTYMWNVSFCCKNEYFLFQVVCLLELL